MNPAQTLRERILLELSKEPQGLLRRNQLLKRLYPEYSAQYTQNSFDVVLCHKLRGLCRSGDIKRIDKGHQTVFYQLSKGLLAELSLAVLTIKEKGATIKELVTSLEPVEAYVFLGEVRRSLLDVITFVEDIYRLLPKNAELDRNGRGHLQTTGTGEERRESEAFHKKTGGRVQVSIPEKRRE